MVAQPIKHTLQLLSPALQTIAQTTRPKLGRFLHQNLRGNMPCILRIDRTSGARARLSGSKVYDPASILDGGTLTTTVTVTGAVLGDPAQASFSLSLQGILVTAYVSAADTVTVVFQNETGGTLDLASGTLLATTDSPVGTVAIWGANLQNPWAGRPLTNVFRGRIAADGAGIVDVTRANATTGDYTLVSNLPYVAFSNNNWILLASEFDQRPLLVGVTNGGYAVSDNGSGLAQFTFSLFTLAATGSLFTFDLEGVPYETYDAGTIDLQVKNNGTLAVLTTDYTVGSTVSLLTGETIVRITFIVAPTTGNVTIRPFLKANAQLGVAFVVPVAVKAAAANVGVDEDITSRDAMWAVLAGNFAPTLAIMAPSGR